MRVVLLLCLLLSLSCFVNYRLWHGRERREAPPLNPFEQHSAEEIAEAGALFFLPHLSRISSQHKKETVNAFSLYAPWRPTDFYNVDLGVQMLSVRVEAPNAAAKMEDRLRHHGVVAIPRAISDAALLAAAAQEAVRCIRNPRHDSPFGSIMKPEFRKDMPLDFVEPFLEVLYRAIAPIEGVLRNVLGDNVTLVEFSSLTSFPGAEAQMIHPDAHMDHPRDCDEWAKLISCYLYLSDVSETQAALDVWPGTHTHFHFLEEFDAIRLQDATQETLVRAPAVRMAVPAGTMVLFDSRVHHRGTANTSPRVRPTLYFSLMGAGTLPDGPTFTLKSKYKNAVTLDDIVAHRLAAIEQSTQSKPVESWRQQLEMCTKAMYARCSKEMQQVWGTDEVAPVESSTRCFQCGEREFVNRPRQFSCGEQALIERICRFGIFHPHFKTEL